MQAGYWRQVLLKIKRISQEPLLQPCNLEGLNYQFDPYLGCEHFCFYCYALNQDNANWEEEISVYSHLEEHLSEELSHLSPQTIYLGMNSDPYQPLERELKQTRLVLELLQERGFSACILTKSGLVTRDIDLLATMPDSSAGVSLAFSDDRDRLLFERNTPSNEVRIKALEALHAAGISTYILLCPVFPFLTNVEEVLLLAKHCVEAIYAYRLRMQSPTDRNWQFVDKILRTHYPAIADDFSEIVFSSTHSYWQKVARELEELRDKYRLNLEIHFK